MVGKLIGAYAGCVLLLGAAQAQEATVVTDHVISQATRAQSNIPVTFGQVFKTGDVPSGATLTASINGQPVTLQVDTKAINPDGSLRHAVLTAMVPSLPGSAKMPLTLATGAGQTAAGTPIALSQLLDTPYDAGVSFIIDGKNYTADARALLQTASDTDACAPWDAQCNVWLSGPLVSAWVVNGPLTAADGTTNPNLRIYFAVRAYASATPGMVGYVRTDIIVENSSAFSPQAQPQYSATLTSGTASYTSPQLTQYAYTRWHKALWWNNFQPKVYLQQDTQYIQNSMAVSRYQKLQPDQSFLANVRQSCAPLTHCDQTKGMANPGAQPAIGPLPRWTSVYIVDPDIRAYNWMLANTDALGAYSIHYRDQATDWPISIQKHPYVTIIGWSFAHQVSGHTGSRAARYRKDLLPNCVKNSELTQRCTTSWYSTSNPNTWSNAHQPAEGYVAYMVTGSYYYMEELAFGASHNEIWSSETYRGFSKGLINASHGQPRGKAWVLREMVNAAYLLPDGYPLKAEFNVDVSNSIADFNTSYTDNPDASKLGVLNSGTAYPRNGQKKVAMAPWQHNFLTWSAGHAAELGFTGAAGFRDWLAKFEIGLMTDWQSKPTDGFCWLEAAAYSIQVKDANGNWLPSYTKVYDTNWPTFVGLACNTPPMLAELSKLRGKPVQLGEMSGYPYSATGYPANFQIGVATAADSGLPNAQAAWNLFDSRSVKPSGHTAYNNYPNFALVPRFLPATVTPPPTTPPPPTPPAATPPSKTPPPASLPWTGTATKLQTIRE